MENKDYFKHFKKLENHCKKYFPDHVKKNNLHIYGSNNKFYYCINRVNIFRDYLGDHVGNEYYMTILPINCDILKFTSAEDQKVFCNITENEDDTVLFQNRFKSLNSAVIFFNKFCESKITF